MSGFGLAGFANGLNAGLNTGARLFEMSEQGKIAKVREQGIAEAQALQAKAAPQVVDNGDMQNLTSRPQMSADPKADNSVDGAAQAIPEFMRQSEQAETQRQGWAAAASQSSRDPKLGEAQPEPEVPARAGGFQLTQPKRFTVGSKEFDTEGDAKKFSQSQAPALETFYSQTLVPKMKEALLAQGKPEEAARWEKYAEQEDAKRTFKDFSKVMLLAEKGDTMGAAEGLIKLYDDYDDGWKVVSSERATGEDGTPGFTMKIRDEDGNERTMFQTAETITEQALWRASPYEMFKMRDQRKQKSLELKAKAKFDAENDARVAARTLGVAGVRAKTQKELQEDKQAYDASKTEKVEGRKDARQQRQLDARVQAAAEKVRAQTAKRGMTPERARTESMKIAGSNPMSATWSREEKEAEAQAVYDYIMGGKGDSAPAGGGTTPNPFEGGGAQKGVPVFKNGKIEFVSR